MHQKPFKCVSVKRQNMAVEKIRLNCNEWTKTLFISSVGCILFLGSLHTQFTKGMLLLEFPSEATPSSWQTSVEWFGLLLTDESHQWLCWIFSISSSRTTLLASPLCSVSWETDLYGLYKGFLALWLSLKFGQREAPSDIWKQRGEWVQKCGCLLP